MYRPAVNDTQRGRNEVAPSDRRQCCRILICAKALTLVIQLPVESAQGIYVFSKTGQDRCLFALFYVDARPGGEETSETALLKRKYDCTRARRKMSRLESRALAWFLVNALVNAAAQHSPPCQHV